MTFDERLNRLVRAATQAITQAQDLAALEMAERAVLGRKGTLTLLLKELAAVPAADRAMFGARANNKKRELLKAIQQRKAELGGQRRGAVDFDPTLPGLPVRRGHMHPISRTTRRIVEIFSSMGFEVVEGPEVELEKYNFDLLNIPPEHPARDLQDTFYVSGKNRVLRTHTSPVQLRAMETRRPPVRLIVPGRVYRNEATDASHEAALFQCEGLVIDAGIRLTDLFGTIDAFLKSFYGPEVVTRAQASYFPFVEPGAEIAMRCLICTGRGCSVCKRTGWLEMMGCGMVHPVVLKNMKVDPKRFSGFAFGMGIDRLTMLAAGVDDIRLFQAGDLRFLTQF